MNGPPPSTYSLETSGQLKNKLDGIYEHRRVSTFVTMTPRQIQFSITVRETAPAEEETHQSREPQLSTRDERANHSSSATKSSGRPAFGGSPSRQLCPRRV